MAEIRELSAQIAANYATNADSAEEVMKLLHDCYNTLLTMQGGEPVALSGKEAGADSEAGPERREPIMRPQKALSNNAINCLVCGKEFKTLKRHLYKAHGLTPRAYREAFDLDKDYPLVAPSLSQQRSQVAKENELGERLAEARRKRREDATSE